MKTIWTLSKRNIQIYLHDRTTVFFSMLTILIIITLNMFFLEKMNVDNLLETITVERETATYLVSSLTLAGIVFTSTLTVPLCIIGIMIDDKEHNRIMAFMVAPISRLKLALSYILAAFIMGSFLAFITLGISQIYFVCIGGSPLRIESLLKLSVAIIINVFTNACMVFFFATCLNTANSFSTLNAILGTLIGFIAGIYLPIGILPEGVQNIMKCFPGLYGASMMRSIYSSDALSLVFKTAPLSAIQDYSNTMGITLVWGNWQVNSLTAFLILLASGILFIVLSIFILNRKKVRDR